MTEKILIALIAFQLGYLIGDAITKIKRLAQKKKVMKQMDEFIKNMKKEEEKENGSK